MNPGDITIRVADANDSGSLALVGAATMLETYADKIAGCDIVAHCQNRHAAAVYAGWLAEPEIIIWVAETRTRTAIGYLVLMRATLPTPAPDPRDLEVQRIYVLSRFHGAGLGHRLMQLALDRARTLGARQVVLGVLKTNERAVAFYRRQGFAPIANRTFVVGTATFDDHVMGLRL